MFICSHCSSREKKVVSHFDEVGRDLRGQHLHTGVHVRGVLRPVQEQSKLTNLGHTGVYKVPDNMIFFPPPIFNNLDFLPQKFLPLPFFPHLIFFPAASILLWRWSCFPFLPRYILLYSPDISFPSSQLLDFIPPPPPGQTIRSFYLKQKRCFCEIAPLLVRC